MLQRIDSALILSNDPSLLRLNEALEGLTLY
jgi:hypothetical protein